MCSSGRSSPLLRCLGICVLAVSVVACAAKVDTRGNLPDPELLAEITPGEHSRDEVSEILGSPSSIAAFDRETWFYISKRTETFAFFAPEVNQRQVVIVRFDKKGVVTEVKTLGLDDARSIDPVDRETPTAGSDLSLFQQLFGNIGRFNKPGE